MMMVRCVSLLLLVGAAQGFVAPSSLTAANTKLAADATGFDNFCVEAPENRAVTPEDARRFRRTVYTHNDWAKHRQQDRFVTYVSSTFSSGIWQNAKNEILLATAIATFVVVYNALRGGYTDFAGVAHAAPWPGQTIGLPLSSFTLTGSSLGLLLSKYNRIRQAVVLCLYLTNRVILQYCSFPCQHLLQTLGRSAKELGNEYQPHP